MSGSWDIEDGWAECLPHLEHLDDRKDDIDMRSWVFEEVDTELH